MAGRGVDKARAGVVGDVIAIEQRHIEAVARIKARERMGAGEDVGGVHIAHALEALGLGGFHHIGGELVGEHIERAGLRPVAFRRRGDAIEAIGDLVRIGDRAVARQGPGSRGPDDDAGAHEGVAFAQFRDGESDPDRVAHMVLVFHFRFRQRGLLHHRPHHGFGAAIEQAVFGEFHDLAGDLRLRVKAHGGVGMGPVAGDAQALEFLALGVEPALRIGAALPAEGDHGGAVGELGLGLALGAVIVFLDLPLDGQAVAVPARHIVRVLAQHGLRAADHVLEDLVQGVADVDVAIGVGGAVVQHEFRPTASGLAHELVEVHRLPAGENLRLLLRQARAHGELGLRQVERL